MTESDDSYDGAYAANSQVAGRPDNQDPTKLIDHFFQLDVHIAQPPIAQCRAWMAAMRPRIRSPRPSLSSMYGKVAPTASGSRRHTLSQMPSTGSASNGTPTTYSANGGTMSAHDSKSDNMA